MLLCRGDIRLRYARLVLWFFVAHTLLIHDMCCAKWEHLLNVQARRPACRTMSLGSFIMKLTCQTCEEAEVVVTEAGRFSVAWSEKE